MRQYMLTLVVREMQNMIKMSSHRFNCTLKGSTINNLGGGALVKIRKKNCSGHLFISKKIDQRVSKKTLFFDQHGSKKK